MVITRTRENDHVRMLALFVLALAAMLAFSAARAADASATYGTLKVIKHVVNDNGGTKTASNFTLSVKKNGTNVSGSPAPGSETGKSYSLYAGTYTVSEAAMTGYTATFSGNCDSSGVVSVVVGSTKTCTITNNDDPNVAIHVTKEATDGDDIVQSGSTVTYEYGVTNPGAVPLSNVTVTDNKCSPVKPVDGNGDSYNDGDADKDNKLDTTETWQYTCDKVLTATTTNTVTASGTYNCCTVTSTAQETVAVVSSGIDIEKAVSDDHVQIGQNVIYRLEVSNSGNDHLSNIAVTDENCPPSYQGGDGDGDGMLDPGEIWVYTCTRSFDTVGNKPNTAAVEGTSTSSDKFKDDDSAQVLVEKSEIKIEKSVNDDHVQTGQNVTYTLAVTNPGSDVLANIVVDDPDCKPEYQGGDANNDDKLDTNETWTYTCTRSFDSTGTKNNTATVAGTSGSGETVNDDDTAQVVVERSGIQIQKSVNHGHVQVGQEVTYTLDVTNTGTDALSDVIVSDPDCTPVMQGGDTNDDKLLDTTETWTYTCSKSFSTAGAKTNTATATGKSTTGSTVEDDDSAQVMVEKSEIQVTKQVSDAVVYDGTEVAYTMRVTNPGTDALHDVVLSDPDCAPIVPSGNSGDTNGNQLLDPGEEWVYTCSRVVHTSDEDPETGFFTNQVSASGTSTTGDSVTDTDTAKVNVINPALKVTKKADKSSVTAGTTVTFTINVENTGDSPLHDLVVEDQRCDSKPAYQGGDADDDGDLGVGETWNYTCSAVISQNMMNVATATGLDLLDGPVSASGEAPVAVENAPVEPKAKPVVTLPVFAQCISKTLVLKPSYSNGSPVKGVLYIDGKRVKTVKGTNPKFKVKVNKYKAGTHKTKAVFTYSDGTTIVVRGKFKKCAARVTHKHVSPKFTG